jgi:hypothetical protein
MQGISHYSYPYLKQQKIPSVLLINIYTLSSRKLEIRAEKFLLRFGGLGDEGERGGTGGGRKMTQTLYAHMNKRNFKK